MTTDHYFEQKIPGSLLSFRMVQAPGGEFLMGNNKNDPDAYESEMPQHKVRLDGFWMAEIPVTQALWETVMGNNPSRFKGPGRPVEQVSWFDAAVFCNALSHNTRRTPAYLASNGQYYGLGRDAWKVPDGDDRVTLNPHADGYRLPTEAQWEFAAKGGYDSGYRYSGSDLLDQVGWYEKNSDSETHDAGLLLPNALGLYDMSGNVWEWCNDWYAAYPETAQENPAGPAAGVYRVMRGGGWGVHPRYCRPAYRISTGPAGRLLNLGFRLVLQSVG